MRRKWILLWTLALITSSYNHRIILVITATTAHVSASYDAPVSFIESRNKCISRRNLHTYLSFISPIKYQQRDNQSRLFGDNIDVRNSRDGKVPNDNENNLDIGTYQIENGTIYIVSVVLLKLVTAEVGRN